MEPETKPRRTKRITTDKPLMWSIGGVGLLGLATLLLTLIRLRSHDLKVPVEYMVHNGTVLHTDYWFSLYSLIFSTLLGAAIIVGLALRLHKGNRWFAIGLLIVYATTQVFSLLAINGLLGRIATL